MYHNVYIYWALVLRNNLEQRSDGLISKKAIPVALFQKVMVQLRNLYRLFSYSTALSTVGVLEWS